MRSVMIATPAHDKRVGVHFADGIANTVRAALDMNIMPVYWPGEAMLPHARNELFRMAVEHKVDDLLWIDADQGFSAEDVLQILAHPVDVVGAPVRKKTLDAELYNVRAASATIPVDMATGLLIVDGVGTGFLRMSARAVNALWDKAIEYYKDGHTCRMVFETPIVDGNLVSEDFALCEKLKAAGFKIHLDATLNPSHFGTVEFKGNFAPWLKQLQQRAA